MEAVKNFRKNIFFNVEINKTLCNFAPQFKPTHTYEDKLQQQNIKSYFDHLFNCRCYFYCKLWHSQVRLYEELPS